LNSLRILLLVLLAGTLHLPAQAAPPDPGVQSEPVVKPEPIVIAWDRVGKPLRDGFA
jgi:hypothetical protein